MNKPLVLALVLLFCTPTLLQAQQMLKEPPGKWWKDPRIASDLKLAPEQRAKIESIWLGSRRGLIDKKAELDKWTLDLSELISKRSVDEGAAVDLFEKVQASRRAIERETFLMRLRIKNVLSAEQQDKLEELSATIQRPNRK